jgi:hypothetical protein
VGAGLPILNTVQSLALSGDKIQSIEGILSGTLSYIFNTYDGSMPFSEVVKQAKAVRFISAICCGRIALVCRCVRFALEQAMCIYHTA